MCWLVSCLLLVFVICRLVRHSVCGSYFKTYLMVCCFVLLVCLLTVGCGIWLVFAGFSVVVYLMGCCLMVLYVFCLDAFLLVWISLIVVCFCF